MEQTAATGSGLEAQTPRTTAPSIPIHPLQHKSLLALRVGIIFLAGCLVQESCFFGLYYGTTVSTTYILTIAGVVFGIPAVYSLAVRIWRLTQRAPVYRPLGCESESSRWSLDFFMWNFLAGFVYITVLISLGTAFELVELLAMPLPLLMLRVCGEVLLTQTLRACGLKTPFRVSSTGAGERIPSAVSVIVEDVLAVDAGAGVAFRRAWRARIGASPVFDALLHRLDFLWGCTGVVVAGGLVAVIWAVPERGVGYGLGWAVPWAWALCMGAITYGMVKTAQKEERRSGYHVVSADIAMN